MAITEGEWAEWARSGVTRAFLGQLRETHQDTLEAWGQGKYLGEDGQSTLQYNAKALGGLDMLQQLIDRITNLQEVKE